MTPLAFQIIKQKTLPTKRRVAVVDPYGVAARLTDFHCFEASAAMPMVEEISRSVMNYSDDRIDAFLADYVFLPAPRTWIEWKAPWGQRIGFLLEDTEDGWATVTLWQFSAEVGVTVGPLGRISTKDATWDSHGKHIPFLEDTAAYLRQIGGKWPMLLLSTLHFVLLLINTPKLIGRRQYMPHRGLERKLTKQMGVGKFPLHAWTEIRLEINKPIEIDDGEPHEAHLTGRRALHFCRAHLRIRHGKLECVSSHWRGDPALGIKQQRYKLAS